MSRLLLVEDDPRTVPYSELQWWRTPLRPIWMDGDRYYYVLERDDAFDQSWSGTLTYEDGQDDWSFPYAWVVRPHVATADIYPTPRGGIEEPVRTIISARHLFLDVLDTGPPGMPKALRHRGFDIENWQHWTRISEDWFHPDHGPIRQYHGTMG